MRPALGLEMSYFCVSNPSQIWKSNQVSNQEYNFSSDELEEQTKASPTLRYRLGELPSLLFPLSFCSQK